MLRADNLMLKSFFASILISALAGVICPPATVFLTQSSGFSLLSVLPGAFPLFLPSYVLALFLVLLLLASRIQSLGSKVIIPIGLGYLIGPTIGILISLPLLGLITGQGL